MTEREQQKFKIYVRRGGKVKVKSKQPNHKNPSAVAFVLRHISSRDHDEAMTEANRLLKVVDHTPADRAAVEQVLKSRCRRKSQ